MHYCRAETTPKLLEHLARIGTFSVSTCQRSPDSDEIVPAHSAVIRPLLASATAAFVWPPSPGARTLDYPVDILTADGRRYRFDLSREALTGYERFWNASASRRGSIVLRLSGPPVNMAEIFRHCSGPGIYSSRYQLAKGNSPAALRYCAECAKDGDLAFCFSASNGIEHLALFAAEPLLKRLYLTAFDLCRPFKRWFECAPGESVNLVGPENGSVNSL